MLSETQENGLFYASDHAFSKMANFVPIVFLSDEKIAFDRFILFFSLKKENLKHKKILDPLGQAWQNGNASAA